MVPRLNLTPTSYVVLGLVANLGEPTSYDLKRTVANSIGYFWTFPHSQLYAEPARLVEGGLLTEEAETTGRRRRRYRITDEGRTALAAWLREPIEDTTEVRDLGLLKLFFSGRTDRATVVGLAEPQRNAHQQRSTEYERLRTRIAGHADPFQLATLEMGMRFERTAADFWADVMGEVLAAEASAADEPRRLAQ